MRQKTENTPKCQTQRIISQIGVKSRRLSLTVCNRGGNSFDIGYIASVLKRTIYVQCNRAIKGNLSLKQGIGLYHVLLLLLLSPSLRIFSPF